MASINEIILNDVTSYDVTISIIEINFAADEKMKHQHKREKIET